MNKIILTTHDLTIGYTRPTRIVAADVNVSLSGGELVCLIGPNGAGKSTLLRTLAGMQPALNGQVRLMDDDIGGLKPQELARRLSIVLTERVSVGMLPVYELVALGRYPYTDWSGKLTLEDEAVVFRAIEAVGAGELARRQVGELSDGERQKVMIARALAQEPGLMLLDEPTAFLDLPRRVEIMRMLRELARSTGRAILLSTHDLDLALRTADRIWLMPMRGSVQVGAPEDLVLSGAFEAAFHSEGVEFDRRIGSFRVSANGVGQVTLVGEGVHALWTRRALEREGFTITENGAPTHIEIVPQGDGARWRVMANGTVHEHDTLYSLVASLRENQ